MAGTKRRASSSKNKSNKKVEPKSNKKRLSSKKGVLVKEVADEETEKVEDESAVEESKNKLHKESDKNDGDDQVPANNTSTSKPTTTNSGLVILDRMINEFTIDTWWMVDLQADPAPRQGATLLVRRCMKAYDWNENKARSVLKAYRQFLFIKKEKKDWNAEILSPSCAVDRMWHQHILDVVDYAHDCMLLCGFVVGHKPDGMWDEEGRQRRRNATRQALLEHFPNVDRSWSGEWMEIFFPNEVLEILPNEVLQARNGGGYYDDDKCILQVRCPELAPGKTYFVQIKSSTRMERILNFLVQKMAVPASSLRLLQDGERIVETETPRMLALKDFDEVIGVLEQTGC